MGSVVRGRFAPSPSGRMHFGNIFSACLAWLSARSQGGEFIVRLEDIDERCKNPQNSVLLLEDLAWLGIDWDEEPLRQRARSNIYADVLEQIGEKALVYPCFCSRADLHSASAPHASDGTPLYAGTCRGLALEEVAAKRALKDPAMRVAVPCETVSFVDKRMGACQQQLDKECGDFVLRRSDGAFAYQLVVVVDDYESGVTEVVRGADLIGSSPRQIWLHKLLGHPVPEYAHHPVLMSPDGRRLSKRDKSLDMGVMRNELTPEQMVGKVAFLAGLIDSEQPVALRELVSEFSWDKLPAGDITLEL